MSVASRIAHVATPWDWTRRWITLFVIAGVAFNVYAVVRLSSEFTYEGAAPTVISIGLGTLFWWLMVIRPMVRSVRRWRDQR